MIHTPPPSAQNMMTKQVTTQIFALVAELSSPSDMSSPSAVHLITLSMTTPSDMRMPGAKYAPEVNPQGAIAETCAGRSLGSFLHSHSYSCCPAFRAIAM